MEAATCVAASAGVSGDPHSRQNLACAGFSALHLEQRMVPLPASHQNAADASRSAFKADRERQQGAQPYSLGSLE
jgi:hypothetical protein